MVRYYDWDATFSRQTGDQGEFCIVSGGKGIGKTFGLRLRCIREFVKKGYRFVEVCRTKEERKEVEEGYFDKLQHEGFFTDNVFKVEKHRGFCARKPVSDDDKPEWKLCAYFVALTAFQVEKRRTYSKVHRFIFDEAAIDTKDRYHRYLPDEFFILANIIDSITREQSDGKAFYKVYLLMNSCDLSCPYFRYLGINKVPEFGYTFYRDKHVLLHYVEPWDAQERVSNTLVGRLLDGTSEADMVFGNEFRTGSTKDVRRKPKNAKFAYGLKFESMVFGVWIDYARAYVYVTDKVPNGGKPVFALTKNDGCVDYTMLRRSDEYMRMLVDMHYKGFIRYSSLGIRECFFKVLEFLGVK